MVNFQIYMALVSTLKRTILTVIFQNFPGVHLRWPPRKCLYPPPPEIFFWDRLCCPGLDYLLHSIYIWILLYYIQLVFYNQTKKDVALLPTNSVIIVISDNWILDCKFITRVIEEEINPNKSQQNYF